MNELVVLFVCTGNTCRSPMAASILRQLLKERDIAGVRVESAGTAAAEGLPAAFEAREVLRDRGFELSEHKSRPVSRQQLVEADIVLTMTEAHRSQLVRLYPGIELSHKVHVLKQFALSEAGEATRRTTGADISDPLDCGRRAYRRTAQEIEEALGAVLHWIVEQISGRQEEANMSRVCIGSDHAGFELKQEIVAFLEKREFEVRDMGTYSMESVDYPDYAQKVAAEVAAGSCRFGILVCGTGIGMSMAANKLDGIRAALCHDVFSARATRRHNDANVLALGSRVVGKGLALEIVEAWLEAEFEGGRHKRRVDKIHGLE